MVKYIPSQKNRINLSIRFSFNIPDHQGASDELQTLNKCLRGRCYFPPPHGIKILWLEAPDKPDSVLWKAGRETVSNCSLMNELITKLSLTAGIPMGRKGLLCWWTSFPSLTSTKINNLILGKSGLPGRHNVFGVFTAAGDLGAKGQGMRSSRLTDMKSPSQRWQKSCVIFAHLYFVGFVCLLQMHLFGFLTKPDPHKGSYKSFLA